MTGHKVRVVRRGGGHVAQCVAGGCPAITGVWDTNAEARQSLSLQAHEEAPGAVGAAAEGKDTEPNTHERPESMNTVTDLLARLLALFEIEVELAPRPSRPERLQHMRLAIGSNVTERIYLVTFTPKDDGTGTGSWGLEVAERFDSIGFDQALHFEVAVLLAIIEGVAPMTVAQFAEVLGVAQATRAEAVAAARETVGADS